MVLMEKDVAKTRLIQVVRILSMDAALMARLQPRVRDDVKSLGKIRYLVSVNPMRWVNRLLYNNGKIKPIASVGGGKATSV